MPRSHHAIVTSGLVLALLVLAAPARADEPGTAPAAAQGRPWLGVWLVDAVDGGAQVVALTPGGPGWRAGLRAGDVIVQVGERPIADQAELARGLDGLAPGRTLHLGLLRDGRYETYPVRLASRPPQAAAALADERRRALETASRALQAYRLARHDVGLRVDGITPALRRHYGAPEQSGVLVTRVEPGGLAERAGIAVGDVIVRVADEEVDTAGQVRGTLVGWNGEAPLETRVIRAGRPLVLRLEIPADSAARVRAPAAAAEQRTVRRALELEIERLELRLGELRRELDRLRAEERGTDAP